MEPISFPSIQATNIPVGSQSERNPGDLIIDLTSEDNQPMNSHNNNAENNNQPTPATGSDLGDDDIIFTGENRPVNHTAFNLGHRRQNDSSSTPSHINPANLSGRMATLTANIYAGYYSRNLRNDPPPQQGSSNLTVRDSPPLQTRSSTTRTINFGGGGRFSGGRFSGFLAAGFNAGLNGLRNLANGNITGTYQPPTENLEQAFSNWGTNEFHRFDLEDNLPTTRFMNSQGHGNFLALSPHEIFAAIYDFDHANQTREPVQPGYKETDSHPLKIKRGFSKEIIPLDREVLSLDSDSQSNPLLEKQDLRPVCASCDKDLMLGQDSNLTSLNGRRPWILACGHVVDYRCLEQARIRAREIKLETKKEKTKTTTNANLTPKRSLQTCTRASRSNNRHQTNDPLKLNNSRAFNNKRRKLSSTNNASNGKPPSQLTTSISDSALRRKERANAREARKSADFHKCSFSLSDYQHNSNSSSSTITGKTHSAITNHTNVAGHDTKGKCKATEDKPIGSLTNEAQPHEDGKEDIMQSTSKNSHLTDKLKPTSSSINDNHTSSVSSINNNNHPSSLPSINRNHPSSLVDAHLAWVKCPVKGCKANKGDILAPPGSKNAPWEMFV